MRSGLSRYRLRRVVRAGLAAAAAAAVVSCAGPELPPLPVEQPAQPIVATAPSPAPGQIYRETGTASWYGKDFHGRKTANGETYDMNGVSAAHRTLPLGTVIRVTNLDNFRSVKVRVNERGPFVRSRILDCSYGAARELGFVAQGTARVKIETLEPVQDAVVYTVQAAAFIEEENARTLRERLSRKFEQVQVVSFESNVGRFYRVRVGAYSNEEKAEKTAARLTLEGLEPVVIRKD